MKSSTSNICYISDIRVSGKLSVSLCCAVELDFYQHNRCFPNRVDLGLPVGFGGFSKSQRRNARKIYVNFL